MVALVVFSVNSIFNRFLECEQWLFEATLFTAFWIVGFLLAQFEAKFEMCSECRVLFNFILCGVTLAIAGLIIGNFTELGIENVVSYGIPFTFSVFIHTKYE